MESIPTKRPLCLLLAGPVINVVLAAQARHRINLVLAQSRHRTNHTNN
jgi:hypothetical protein